MKLNFMPRPLKETNFHLLIKMISEGNFCRRDWEQSSWCWEIRLGDYEVVFALIGRYSDDHIRFQLMQSNLLNTEHVQT